MKRALLLLLLSSIPALAAVEPLPVAVRSTNGTARGITLSGAVTNLVVGATKIIGTDAQSREKGVTLSGLTWDGTTLAIYAAPTITSFVNDHPSVEIGATVSDTILTWTLGGGAITSQSLNQSIGARPIGDRNYTDTADYDVDDGATRTYTLTAGDGTTTVQASTSVSFQSKAYWGVSTATTLTDAEIRAFAGQEFATGRQRTKSITANNEYIYLIYPSDFGLATRFVVDGFQNTAWTLEGGSAQSFVNAQTYPRDYYIYRSNLPAQPGIFEIEIE